MLNSILGITTSADAADDEKTAEALARAALEKSEADFGLGVAALPCEGPPQHTATAGGNERTERTGTLQVALATAEKITATGFPLANHPAITKTRAAKHALNMLRLALLNREA
jgi:nicotinamide mononucleotide (NMN) deamidase PncC